MGTREEELSRAVELFLRSRKSQKTKKYAKMIIEFLDSQHDVKTQGWIQAKVLKDAVLAPDKIPNSSTFFNLLSDLEDFGLVDRTEEEKRERRRGRPHVFYRLALIFPTSQPDKDELDKDYRKLLSMHALVLYRLRAAEHLLGKCCKKYSDPHVMREEIKSLANEEIKHVKKYSMEMNEKIIEGLSPIAQQYLRKVFKNIELT